MEILEELYYYNLLPTIILLSTYRLDLHIKFVSYIYIIFVKVTNLVFET